MPVGGGLTAGNFGEDGVVPGDDVERFFVGSFEDGMGSVLASVAGNLHEMFGFIEFAVVVGIGDAEQAFFLAFTDVRV